MDSVDSVERSVGRSNGSIGVAPVGRSTDRGDDDDGGAYEGWMGVTSERCARTIGKVVVVA